MRYLTPLMICLINTLYAIYLSFTREERKGRKGRKKLYKKNESHTSKNLDLEKN